MVVVTVMTMVIVGIMLTLVSSIRFEKTWPKTYRVLVVVLPGVFGGIQVNETEATPRWPSHTPGSTSKRIDTFPFPLTSLPLSFSLRTLLSTPSLPPHSPHTKFNCSKIVVTMVWPSGDDASARPPFYSEPFFYFVLSLLGIRDTPTLTH